MSCIFIHRLTSDRICDMDDSPTVIQPIDIRDLVAITRMTFKNMAGVDRHFDRITRNPIGRATHFIKMPIYLAYAGKGYKAIRNKKIVGCAYVHFRRVSAYIFNVSVNQAHRRQGVGRMLMEELERISQGKGYQWMALQVDDGNQPAQRLYQGLGYKAYHPHYLHKYGDLSRIQNGTNRLVVKPMPQYQGEQLFHRYYRTEVISGDPWFAQVLEDYNTIPRSRRQFWRCVLHDREIGCAMLSERYQRLQIRLVCQPDYWGDDSTAQLVKLLVESIGGSPLEIDVYLGSNAHHQAATQILARLGFQPRTRWRMLMFKAFGQ